MHRKDQLLASLRAVGLAGLLAVAAGTLAACPSDTTTSATACTGVSECAGGEICAAGFCGTCSADVQCQADYGSGATCVDGGCVAASCPEGTEGCPCASDGTCDGGLCVDDVCAACSDGAAGCPCYGNGTCDAGATCGVGDVCVACTDGTLGCPCDAGSCEGGAVCGTDDVCVACTAGVIGCPCDAGACDGGAVCGTDDVCVACTAGVVGCPCDAGTCEDGAVCGTGDVCVACADGAVGCPCAADASCDSGGYCVAGLCEACVDGVIGCPCHADATCDAGATCGAGSICEACSPGVLGCPCDAGTCATGSCVAGACVDCVAGTVDCACKADDTCNTGLSCGSDGICFTCPVATEGCACDGAQTCQPGLTCAADTCIPDDCTAGTVGCTCDTGDVCSDADSTCDDGICVTCSSNLAGCPCDAEGECGGGLVCDTADVLCREPLACADACVAHQDCEENEGADPTCLESCEDGWQWNTGTEACDPAVELTCTPNAPGSIATDCANANKTCDSSVSPAKCGPCLDFFTDEGGALTTCRPVYTCAEVDCAAQNKACTAETATADATCGACVDFFIDDGVGGCKAVETCASLGCAGQNKACTAETVTTDAACGACLDYFKDDGTGGCEPVATCTSLDCAGQNKACTAETATTDAACGGCLDFFLDDGNGGCAAVDTCTSLGCAGLFRECTPATATTNAACGGCLFDYVEDGAVCVPAPSNCDDGAPGSLLATCTAANKQCVGGTGTASCGDCLDGYALDGNGDCKPITTCVDLGCAAQNKTCEGTYPFEVCGDCVAGTTADPFDPTKCNPPFACSEIECPEDEFCVDGNGVTTGASCIESQCGAGEAYSDYVGGCTSCTVSCGDHPGETGRIWPLTLEGSAVCICETRDDYFWDEGLRSGQPCDADGDGWVRRTARSYVESTDTALTQNARCSVRSIDRVALQNEWGQRAEVRLCDDPTNPFVRADLDTCTVNLTMPLYESQRNDDQGELDLDADSPLYAQGGVGRKFVAAEVNGLTRACTQAGDVNDNGVSDIKEWHGMPASKIPNPTGDPNISEVWILAQFGYYMELHRSYYEPGALGVGKLVIEERSRCDADFPITYGAGVSSDYWRQCTRSRDAAYDPTDALASPEFGLDFAQWSCDATSGSCPIPPPPTNAVPGLSPPDRGLCEVNKPVSDPECGVSSTWECIAGAVWRGMSHHSQFRCVVVDDTASIEEPHMPVGQFLPAGSGQFQLSQCHVACPVGDPLCDLDCPADSSVTWSEATAAAEWSARAGHTVVSHDGQLWLIGGGGGLADVWVSDDGAAWTSVVQVSGFPARTNHAAISWGGKLWVLGGSGGSGPLSDVWSSADGATWIQETAVAAWGPLTDFAVVAREGSLYVIGGDDGGGPVAAVYSSADGAVWSPEVATPFPARRRHTALAFAEEIFVFGGDGASGPLGDVWRTNGDPAMPWTQVTVAADWPARSRHASVAQGGRMWVIGGLDDGTVGSLADAWSSVDGETWTEAAAATADLWTGRYDHAAAVLWGDLFVLGGNAGGPDNQVWKMSQAPACFDSTEEASTALSNPSHPVFGCAIDSAPTSGTVGFAMKMYGSSGGGAYQRGCIDEWAPSSVTDTDTNGAANPEVAAWRDLCPGFASSPKTVVGQGNPAEFGDLQCGCANNYGGPDCRTGCPDDELHVQETVGGVSTPYSAVPRLGWWLCGYNEASNYEATDSTALPPGGCPLGTTEINGVCETVPAHIGQDLSGSVWRLDGAVPSRPATGPMLCEGSLCPADTQGSTAVCDVSPTPCQNNVSYATAVSICEGAGGRLCTYLELKNGEAAGTSCGSGNSVWSSSTCNTGRKWTTAGNPSDFGVFDKCSLTDSDLASVRCCVDACDTQNGWVVTAR